MNFKSTNKATSMDTIDLLTEENRILKNRIKLLEEMIEKTNIIIKDQLKFITKYKIHQRLKTIEHLRKRLNSRRVIPERSEINWPKVPKDIKKSVIQVIHPDKHIDRKDGYSTTKMFQEINR